MGYETLEPRADILMTAIRSIGYTFESALADIIDNSISSGASNIHINFSSISPAYISILDDGCGMNLDELRQAMKYGSKDVREKREKEDLGRFGLGLKTASLSQCKRLTVISKKDGHIYGARWDLDIIQNKQAWVLEVLSETEVEEAYPRSTFIPLRDLQTYETGTIVLWENFDRMLDGSNDVETLFNQKVKDAKNHLEMVFHNFLDSSFSHHVKMFFNLRELKGKDPFLKKHPGTQPLSDEEICLQGEIIKVKPYILPYLSKLSEDDINLLGGIEELRHKQGIYVYRNNRLIIWGTWFRLDSKGELNKLARIRVDIPNSLDSIWEVDIKKSTAILPDVIKQNLRNIVKKSISRSERVYTYKGEKILDENFTHVWEVYNGREEISYKINKNLQLYKEFVKTLDKGQKDTFNSILRLIELTVPYQHAYTVLSKNNTISNSLNENEAEDLINKLLSIVSDEESEDEVVKELRKLDILARFKDYLG